VSVTAADIYNRLAEEWAPAPDDRPYTAINMVATIDGKTVSGARGEPVQDLGSSNDHQLMRKIENAAQAVLIGAASQRSSKAISYPAHLLRIVATRSGNLDYDSRFFRDDPSRCVVLCTEHTVLNGVPPQAAVLRCGEAGVDWKSAMLAVRESLGVSRLLVEGGSDVNGQLIRLNFADELFLTVAPKVRLGTGLPTYADGAPLERHAMKMFNLIEINRIGDEVFLRYRRKGDDCT